MEVEDVRICVGNGKGALVKYEVKANPLIGQVTYQSPNSDVRISTFRGVFSVSRGLYQSCSKAKWISDEMISSIRLCDLISTSFKSNHTSSEED